MRKYLDLTGNTFGLLTVKYRTEDKISDSGKRRIQWMCDCKCGNKNIVTLADSLRSGCKQSCGCIRFNNPKNVNDLTGQKFGRLTVVCRDLDRDLKEKNTLVHWLCKCDCGNGKLSSVTTGQLRGGGTQSCGCLRTEKIQANTKDNVYDLSGDYGIGYCNNYYDNKNYFYFDLEDFDKINQYHWLFDKDGYIVGYNKDCNKNIFMHRLVMNVLNKDAKIPDHIKHIKYDNRKSQLRIVTRSENSMNQRKSTRNTSGVVGVYWDNSRGKWHSQITVKGKAINLGRFENFEDAVKARKEAEEKYFGEYSYDDSMNHHSYLEV